MNDITVAAEKAQNAIDILKDSVLTVLRKATESGRSLRTYEIRDELGIKELQVRRPSGTWGSTQIISVVLYLLKDDQLVEQSPFDSRRWVLSKSE